MISGVSAWNGRLLGVVALVALADGLFWETRLGLSAPVFAAFLVVVASCFCRAALQARCMSFALLVVAVLPAIEHAQSLSLGILALGTLASLAILSGSNATLGRLAALLRSLPTRGLVDGARAVGACRVGPGRLMRDWALPTGGCLVLVWLLVAANPLIAHGLEDAGALFSDPDAGRRVLFWSGVALIVYALVTPGPNPVHIHRPTGTVPGVNARSVARALVLFNGVLGVQTALDATFLWQGAALPEGMSYAAYAHRGAYPLLATATLAGVFALIARPFLDHAVLRGLMVVWLLQNLALTVSAALRLSAYVEAFGLTYLRVHAALWMGLVAAGLLLVVWQIWRRRTGQWLLFHAAGLAVLVLYSASFVNFAHVIAATNLARSGPPDVAYLCALPSTAEAALAEAGLQCPGRAREAGDWREWGFRTWRVEASLTALAQTQEAGRGEHR
ncbi:MAG: DUF4173 domain-containing protein [Pseudomonadota bacterium]